MKLLTESRGSTAEAKYVLPTSGPINLQHIYAANPHTAMTFLQLFDAAAIADVTLGTTVPKLIIGLPLSGATSTRPAEADQELLFQKGLVYAVTSTATGASAPGAAAAVSIIYAQG